MKYSIQLCAGVLMLSLSAAAQDAPKFDLFGGYSRFHFSQSQTGGNVTGNFNGGNGSAAFYWSKWLGIAGDIGASKISSISQGSSTLNVDGNVVSYLIGPRVRFVNKSRVTPFGQLLFGGVHHGLLKDNSPSDCRSVATPCTVAGHENSFGMAAEGGVDFGIAKHFAIRGQGGYFLTRFLQGNSAGFQTHQIQNNSRFSVGVVFH